MAQAGGRESLNIDHFHYTIILVIATPGGIAIEINLFKQIPLKVIGKCCLIFNSIGSEDKAITFVIPRGIGCCGETTQLVVVGGAHVDEITVDFGLKFAGKAGVPLVTEGSAESNLNVQVKFTFPEKKGPTDEKSNGGKIDSPDGEKGEGQKAES